MQGSSIWVPVLVPTSTRDIVSFHLFWPQFPPLLNQRGWSRYLEKFLPIVSLYILPFYVLRSLLIIICVLKSPPAVIVYEIYAKPISSVTLSLVDLPLRQTRLSFLILLLLIFFYLKALLVRICGSYGSTLHTAGWQGHFREFILKDGWFVLLGKYFLAINLQQE